MTAKIKILTALAYDDTRQEADGTLSLMGVLQTGQFDFSYLPFRGRLAIMLVANVTKPGQLLIFPKLRYNSVVKWAAEVELEIQGVQSGVLIPAGQTYASFDEPGKLELLISYSEESEGEVVKTWPINVDDAKGQGSGG